MRKKTKHRKCVGMLLHSYYPSDVRVRREAETLAAEGIEVHIVCIKEPNRPDKIHEQSDEILNEVYIHYISLNRKRGGKLRYLFEFASITFLGLWKLTTLNMKRRFDVVHIHNMPDILVLSGLISKWFGAKLLLDIHDPMSELFQANYHVNKSHMLINLIKLQEWLCYRVPDQLVTVSHPMAQNVAKKSRRPVEAIMVVHNFPDLATFPICEDGLNWPRNNNKFVILYTGTITEHYDLGLAVKAVAIASKNIPNICLRILGTGNRINQILSLAAELDITDKVEYLKPVKVEVVKDIMAKADVGISTHNAGAFGNLYFSNKILEFMTQGLPVLCSYTDTIARYINKDAIFYFESKNVEDLVEKIIFMYNNPPLVQNKIKNAKKLVANYNWQTEKENFIGSYRKLLN